VIEIAKAVSLETIGDDGEQQVSRQMCWGGFLKHAHPTCTKSSEIETAQMRDLVLNGRLGRSTTIAAFLLHRIKPPVWLGPQRQVTPCLP